MSDFPPNSSGKRDDPFAPAGPTSLKRHSVWSVGVAPSVAPSDVCARPLSLALLDKITQDLLVVLRNDPLHRPSIVATSWRNFRSMINSPIELSPPRRS